MPGPYTAFVRTRHPEASTPGFYRAEKLFEDARRLREQMGGDTFFVQLGGETDGIADAEQREMGSSQRCPKGRGP